MPDGDSASIGDGPSPAVGALVIDAAGLTVACDAAAATILIAAPELVVGTPLTQWVPAAGGLARDPAGARLVAQVRPKGRGGFAAEIMAGALVRGRRTVLIQPAASRDLARPLGEDGAPENASPRDHQFLLALNARLRTEARPGVILAGAAEMLGRHIGAGRVGYGRVDPDGDHLVIEADWSDGEMPSLTGRFPLPPSVSEITSYGRGATLVVDDYRRLETATPEELETIRLMGIVGSITVPLVKDGRLVAMMAAQQSAARVWTAAEVWLVEEVAERIWAALERARADARRRDSEARLRALAETQAFLLELGDRLRDEADPRAIIQETQARLGARLHVSRVGFAEVDAAGESFEVHADWTGGAVASVGGRYPVAMLGERAVADYRAGRTRASGDLRASGELLPAIEAMQIAASVTVPLIKGGRLVAMLSVQQSTPRPWTDAEVQLIEEVAERTWSALEWTRAEARVRASEAQFRSVAENMPGLCWVGDVRGRVLWFNGRHRAFFGERIDRQTMEDVVHPEELELVRQSWTAALAESRPLELTVRMRCLDGAYRPFLNRAEPVRGDAGQVVQWCGVLTDLSDQQTRERTQHFLLELGEALRAETAPLAILREASARLGEFLAVDRVGYGEIDRVTGEVVVACDWCAPDLASVAGRHPRPSDDSRLMRGYRKGATFACSNVEEIEAVSDGFRDLYRLMGAQASITAPMVKEGRLEGLFSVYQRHARVWRREEIQLVEEVGERTWEALVRARAETSRRESDALLSTIMTHAPIGIYLRDHEGRYLLANPEIARVIGRPAEEIVGRTAAELLPPDMAERVVERDREVIETNSLVSVEAHSPGRAAYESSLVMRFPVRIRPDGPVQVAGFDIDITSRKQAEAELKRSQEALHQSEKLTALGSLLAGVSHELNNPLSIIVAQAVMMERQAAGTPVAERAGKIRKAADRSARIVQTFLAMARQNKPERKRADLNGIVNAALDLTDYGLRTGGVQVARDLSPDLPPLWADADQLHQVIVNLVINAQQAMAEQSTPRRLFIATRREGAEAVAVEIADSGPGVADDLRRRIFEPFFTTKPQSVGTGVGLSFSQGLVEAHGGKLELLEPEAGGGAIFRITLPVTAAETAEETAARAAAPATEPPLRSALIIDDEPDIADALADLLQLEGFVSEVAVGGRAAQARLTAKATDFDLIVSDLRMPDLDGPALFDWLRQARPELTSRVAFATGDTLGASAVRFLTEAGRPYVEKPFTPESLARMVAEVDARRNLNTEPA